MRYDLVGAGNERYLFGGAESLGRDDRIAQLAIELFKVIGVGEIHLRLESLAPSEEQFFYVSARSDGACHLSEGHKKFIVVVIFDARRLPRDRDRAKLHGLVFFLDDEDALLRQPEQLEELKHPRRDLPRVDLDENHFASVVGIFDHVPHARHAFGNEMSEVTDHRAAPDYVLVADDNLRALDRVSLVETAPAVELAGRDIGISGDEFKILIANAALISMLILILLHFRWQDDPVFERARRRQFIREIIFVALSLPTLKIGHVKPLPEFDFVHRKPPH